MRRSCIAGFWTQGLSTIYMGKPVASRFGTVRRIQDWLIYHFPKSVSFNEKRSRKQETNIQKRSEGMKSELPPGTRKIGECLFRRSVCFRNFPLKRRKQPELMVSLAKNQSVSYGYNHAVASWFIHVVIQVYAPLRHPRSFFFSFERPQG